MGRKGALSSAGAHGEKVASPAGPGQAALDLGLLPPEHAAAGCGLCDGGPTLSGYFLHPQRHLVTRQPRPQ